MPKHAFVALKIKAWENHSKSIRWMPWHKKTMKDVAACDKLRWGGKQPLTRRSPNGETPSIVDRGSSALVAKLEDPVNWNILVAGGTENTNYSLSSGERKGRSLNPNNWGISLVRQVCSRRLWSHMFFRCCKVWAPVARSTGRSKKRHSLVERVGKLGQRRW